MKWIHQNATQNVTSFSQPEECDNGDSGLPLNNGNGASNSMDDDDVSQVTVMNQHCRQITLRDVDGAVLYLKCHR
ncbi:MAG: hypothetical protein KTR14_08780 [Vampirovibrio sp.]|nr:hypothetical protein [Vampirovibrio sp.]